MNATGPAPMPPPGRKLAIGIKVAALRPDMASVWYRGLYPAVHLHALGHRVEVFDAIATAAQLRRFDLVILVKPTTLDDLGFANAARDQGVPVVLDLCDDVFIPGYGGSRGKEAAVCRAVAGIAAAVVTTGPVLAAKLRAMVPAGTPVVEIADPVENEADNAAVMRAFGGAFAAARRKRGLQRLRAVLRPRQRLHALRVRLRPRRRLQAIRAQLGSRRRFHALRARMRIAWQRLALIFVLKPRWKLLALHSAIRPRRRIMQLRDLCRAAPRAILKARDIPIAEWPRRLPGAVWRRLVYLLGPTPRRAAQSPLPAPCPAAPASRPAVPVARPPSPGLPPSSSALPPAPPPVLPAMPAAAEPRPGEARRTVIWFGIKGAAHGDFGIRNLALIAPALARVAAEIPLRLLVVSNGEEEFRRVTAGWPFACEYREWSRETILAELDGADVCVIPNSRDAFSIGKSANRHALALSRGVPVVATAIPALQGMEGFMVLDDWEGGLRGYLSDPARAGRDVAAGRAHVQRAFSAGVLARAWDALLQEVTGRGAGPAAAADAPPRILGFLDLVQDLDVLLPVLEAMRADPRFAPEACISDRLAAASPRVLRELVERGLMPRIVPRKDVIAGRAPALEGIAALLTAAESSHPAHRAPYALAARATARGMPSFTFQHGLENIGLTYFAPDPEHPGPIRFASSRILVWGPVESLPADVLPETRARCVAVGCPKPAEAPPATLPLPPHAGKVVGVFENLHWERYDAAYVQAFLADLGATAVRFPEVLFLVKPHHAARWLAKNPQALAGMPGNLLLADPAQPTWEPFTAAAILAAVDGVITTPSTVALDAARVGRKVAVAGYGLDLPVYAPLPILRGAEDWAGFVAGLSAADADLAGRMERFRARHLLPGQAVPRILDLVAADLATAAAPAGRDAAAA
ncbi:glycosyltransferase [Falsiroseomonas sp.]|uniref:glycosyltransferase n=1 Tax=Falsiroseomonas sp. TaxID=2870721 RepID=UPI0035676C39